MDSKTALLAEAARLGLSYLGVAQATRLEAEARRLEAWLNAGKHGSMHWMAGHFDKRTDPRLLLPGARSVIVVLQNYYPTPAERQPTGLPKISTYAYGNDYHRVLKNKLYQLIDFLRLREGNILAKAYVDSAPVMDRAWAARAGLGWLGKNTMLIHPRAGSYFFIGVILTDLVLAPDAPMTDHCGTCTACLDACPTDALKPYELDSENCISYWTIELKEALHQKHPEAKTHGWAYGCDICNEVCPWNRFASPHNEPELRPLEHILYTPTDWRGLSKSQFNKRTRATAMSRVRHEKFMDNLRLAEEQSDGDGQ